MEPVAQTAEVQPEPIPVVAPSEAYSGPHRVVVIGGGFGGLNVAQRLRRAPVAVTLVDRRNFHLFQPLLYQVATGTLSPADVASPLRHVVGRQKNTRVILDEAIGFDLGRRRVHLRSGEVPYDTLVVTTGASHNYFGHPEWAELAPGLKTIEDATKIRRRVLSAFEIAEREADPAQQAALLTFVLVGAGPTGVELAGAIAEIARNTLRGEFHSIDPARARIVLVEGSDRVLGGFAPKLSDRARAELDRLGVEVRTGWMVTNIQRGAVTIKKGKDGPPEVLEAHTVLWAAGVAASPLGAALAQAAGAEVDRIGRPVVQPDCTLPGHPEIFVLGDLAHHKDEEGQPLPGVAQPAIQQGRYVADVIRRRLAGEPAPPPFRYRDLGSMAVIGRGAAVAEIGGTRLSGFIAWMAWLFIHIMYLVEFENRLLVFVQWAWSYFTWNRSARLITAESEPPPPPTLA